MSWIVTSKATGETVCELFNQDVANAVDRTRFDVLPADEYLRQLNKRIKEGEA